MAVRFVARESTKEERTTVHSGVAGHRMEQQMSRRAQVISLSEQCATLREGGVESRLSERNCVKWRKRFANDPLDGLKDAPRKGRPPVAVIARNYAGLGAAVQRFQCVKHARACEGN